MKLLFLGDVVGQIGSEFVGEKLRSLKKFYGADIVIVNGENSANGNGITPQSAKYLFNHGADIITIQGEAAKIKNSKSLIPKSNNADAGMTPANPYLSLINYIGGTAWQKPGSSMTWDLEVKTAGYYYIGFRYCIFLWLRQSITIIECVYFRE